MDDSTSPAIPDVAGRIEDGGPMARQMYDTVLQVAERAVRERDEASARLAALEAVAEAARAALDVDPTSRAGAEAHIRLEAALDAVPAAETTSEDGVPPPPSR